MGLDSVYLLVSIEDYFEIKISDQEANQIITVQDMIDCVSNHLKITNTKTTIQDKILTQIENCLNLSNKISDYVLYTNDFWNVLSDQLNLKLPIPYIRGNGLLNGLKHVVFGEPKFEWNNVIV